MEKKMETTGTIHIYIYIYRGYMGIMGYIQLYNIGIMGKKMETIIIGYIGFRVFRV